MVILLPGFPKFWHTIAASSEGGSSAASTALSAHRYLVVPAICGAHQAYLAHCNTVLEGYTSRSPSLLPQLAVASCLPSMATSSCIQPMLTNSVARVPIALQYTVDVFLLTDGCAGNFAHNAQPLTSAVEYKMFEAGLLIKEKKQALYHGLSMQGAKG